MAIRLVGIFVLAEKPTVIWQMFTLGPGDHFVVGFHSHGRSLEDAARTIARTLPHIPEAGWIQPPGHPARPWLLDLDGLRGFVTRKADGYPTLVEVVSRLEWLKGQAEIPPDFQLDGDTPTIGPPRGLLAFTLHPAEIAEAHARSVEASRRLEGVEVAVWALQESMKALGEQVDWQDKQLVFVANWALEHSADFPGMDDEKRKLLKKFTEPLDWAQRVEFLANAPEKALAVVALLRKVAALLLALG